MLVLEKKQSLNDIYRPNDLFVLSYKKLLVYQAQSKIS